MSLNSTIDRVSYAGNGSTSSFSFGYKLIDQADLVVIIKDNTTGVETVKTLSTHYTISGTLTNNVYESGVSVTMLSVPTATQTVIIYRDKATVQELELTENGKIPSDNLEKQLDKITMMIQRVKNKLARTIGLKEGFTASFDTTLPNILQTKGYLRTNETSDGFEYISEADLIDIVGLGNTFNPDIVLQTNSLGNATSSTISTTELGYLSGASSNIQTQLNSSISTANAIGSVPNANGITLSGKNLTLQPANSTFGGVVTAIAQSFTGVKTFVSGLIVSSTTQSTDKDTGSIVTEGGLGVEKNINAGGDIVSNTLFQVNGSSSGFVKVQSPASPTSYTLTLPPTSGTADYVLKTNGSGVTDWVAQSGAGGANATLSNLTSPTAINQDLIFNKTTPIIRTPDLSTTGNSQSINLLTGTTTGTASDSGKISLKTGDGNANSGLIEILTGATNAGADTGPINIKTGDSVGNNTGNINITTGIAGSTRGKIKLKDGTEGTVGYVWTQTNADGSGSWQASASSAPANLSVNSTTTAISSTLTKIVFLNTDYATGISYASGTATITTAGKYKVTSLLAYGAILSTTQVIIQQIRINGTSKAQTTEWGAGVNSNYYTMIDRTFNLSIGDTVEIFASSPVGATPNNVNSVEYMTIDKVG